MECLQIDWKSLDGIFEKDDFYESIQAPKWIDFTEPVHPVDDHEWFCGRVGCAHERKSALQTLCQEAKISTGASKESAHTVAPVSIPTARIGVANNKKARGVVSSSLSSLKSTYAKDKVVYHTQLPSIGECKGEAAKNMRRRQPSENENPNSDCKGQDGAFKKCVPFRATECREKKTKISTASSTTLFEQVLFSEASKSTIIFGERDPHCIKSTLATTSSKDVTPVFTSISGARIHKAGGTRTVPSYRNPHLTASLALPLRKSATDPRHPNGSVFRRAEKVAVCRPIRVNKDVKVAVNVHARCKRSDRKEEGTSKRSDTQRDQKPNIHTALPLNVHESKNVKLEIQTIKENVASTVEPHTLRELKEGETICGVDSSVPPMLQQREVHHTVKSEVHCQVQFPHSLQGVGEEGISNDIQTREKEDSIQNTLAKFLENLRLTSHEDESRLNFGKCAFKQRLAHTDCATSLDQGTKQVSVNELDLAECAAKCSSVKSLSNNKSARSLEEEIEADHDEDNALEQEMVESMRCSSHSEAVSSLNGSEMTALQKNGNGDLDGTNDQKASTNNDEATMKTNLKLVTDWQKHRGTKRKSSEINFKMKHASRDHKHEMQAVSLTSQQLKQPTFTKEMPLMICGSKDSHEEHHKKMKTTIVPFRLRTEERGALKGLGLAKEEPRVSTLKEAVVHHALRMPSFGRPFRPQRSTKKLTIPREPNFHLSKTRKACPASN